MKNKVLYAIVSLVLTGCGSMKNMSREDRAGVGAQIGAFVGWLFGGAVGNSIDDDIGGDIGAFVGTAVGGIAGAQIAANTGDVVRVEKRNPGTCRISLVIVNNSFQDALDVEPIVKVEKGRYLKLSEPVKITKITRDDRITYNVMVQASPKLRTGEAVFSVCLKEGRCNGTEEETFTVKTVGGDK